MLSPRTSSDCQHSPSLPPALGFRVSEIKEAQTFPWKSRPIISVGPRGRHSSRERPVEGLEEGAPFSSWQKSAAPAGGDAALFNQGIPSLREVRAVRPRRQGARQPARVRGEPPLPPPRPPSPRRPSARAGSLFSSAPGN